MSDDGGFFDEPGDDTQFFNDLIDVIQYGDIDDFNQLVGIDVCRTDDFARCAVRAPKGED